MPIAVIDAEFMIMDNYIIFNCLLNIFDKDLLNKHINENLIQR
jgi:hypothetical protein